MKLFASIPARTDGTVVLTVDGNDHVFQRGASGAPECEIDDAGVARVAIESGNFYPADADAEEAERLLAAGAVGDSDEDDEQDDEQDESPDAPPVEANTAPKPAARKTAAARK